MSTFNHLHSAPSRTSFISKIKPKGKSTTVTVSKAMILLIHPPDGNTALHLAAKDNRDVIATILLNRDCDPNIQNRDVSTSTRGQTPMDIPTYNEKVRQVFKDYKSRLPGLPIEVQKLDKKSAEVFTSLLGEESYPHFESRVMLAGEQGTGKTTIARYLVGKSPTRFKMSTDGIELYNGLSYMDLERKEWLGGEQDFSLEEITVSRSLLREQKRKSIKLPDTPSTSQVVSDIMKGVSIWDSEGDINYKSNESPSSNASSSTKTSLTIYENVETILEHQFQTSLEDAGSSVININKKSQGRVLRQTSTMQDKEDAYETALLTKHPSSERQSEIPVIGGNILVDSDNVNDQVAQNYTTRKENTDTSSDTQMCAASFDNFTSQNEFNDAYITSGFTGDLHIENVTERGAIRKLKRFFGITKRVKEVKVSITKEKFLGKSSKVGKKKLHNKNIAPIIIWDFGGQDVFYSTHQTFLTYRAIYIIVLDGSRTLDDPCPCEQYLPGKSGHKTARDYLLFWTNTIVTYCKGSIYGFPKIMVVLTHKDQVSASEVEQRRHVIFGEIYTMFHKTPLMQQLVIDDEIFVNAKDKHDPDMAKIKAAIIRESERQPTWGESLPKCFIPLELEFASLIRRNISLITLDHLQKINSMQPIRSLSETELKVFLKFQHSIGKVLYFDERKLADRIILSPTLLIDAFKSIVTDRRFCEGDKEREEIWDAMGKNGVLSKQAIDSVWKRKKYVTFYKDKDYLLNVMTHLDILVEPKRYGSYHTRITADFYYVASMVRAIDDSGYLESADITKRNIAIAFLSPSMMIPPALSFRFISYCLYVWAVRTYGETNRDMLFHRSGVFTVDSSVDMYVVCEDERIVVRLVHAETNTLIMRDMASSVNECLISALEKISQLYIKTSSDESQHIDASFITSICCNSPDNPCILPLPRLANIYKTWTCPSHGIEHNIHTITSWFARKDKEECEPGCPVTNDDFLKVTPSDLHLRRLSLLFTKNDVREIAIKLGLTTKDLDRVLESDDSVKWNFEVLRRCRDSIAVTFRHIKEAVATGGQESIHILCKLVKADSIDFEKEADKWDIVPTEEHIDRLAPLVGNNSLPFLIELGMEFQTWDQITHRQNERDLVRLNKDILEEWRFQFCKMHSLKPTLRNVANAFINIGSAWIGLSDITTEGSFQWTSSQQLTFTDWNQGPPIQPDSKTENLSPDADCVLLHQWYSWQWTDESCSYEHTRAMCEIWMPQKKQYLQESLDKAIGAVNSNKLSISKAATEYGVPRTTISDHVNGKYDNHLNGPSKMLTDEEETSLINYVKYMAERGFPLTRRMLKAFVISIIEKSGRTTLFNMEKGPSNKWVNKLLNRHPELSEKLQEQQDKARRRMSNVTVVD
ncbi:Hypothetical predicted protein [Mytilus galloprovincialis]|uniref:C-type lectin domain-containing protein n=1 Tax=Mytilus galloprovincialis TaxID=29158 RepID=A0A8B6EG36_MYTGA|nr:Hypothetical predicted protein [Mytilus galloprovincialis]